MSSFNNNVNGSKYSASNSGTDSSIDNASHPTKQDNNNAATTHMDCPWIITPFKGKPLTQQQIQYNLLIEMLYLYVNIYNNNIAIADTQLEYYDTIVAPLEDKYDIATAGYIKALHRLYNGLVKLLDEKSCYEPAINIVALFIQQIRIYFKDPNISDEQIYVLMDLPEPLNLKLVADKLFDKRKQAAYIQLYNAGIYVDYKVISQIKDEAKFEKVIQKLVSGHFIAPRSNSMQQWPQGPLTHSLLRTELHRLHTFSLRNLQCRDITWRLHNFILHCFDNLKDPKTGLKKKVTKKLSYSTTDIAEYLLNWDIDPLISYQAATLKQFFDQDLILDKDMEELNKLIGDHNLLMKHLSAEYVYTDRYYLPLIDPDNHQNQPKSEISEFLKIKAQFLKQKTDFKLKASRSLSNCNQASLECLKSILSDIDLRMDFYEKYPVHNEIQPTRQIPDMQFSDDVYDDIDDDIDDEVD
jgi:hypothetical protein